MLYQRVETEDWNRYLGRQFSREALDFLKDHYEDLGEKSDLEWDPIAIAIAIAGDWREYKAKELASNFSMYINKKKMRDNFAEAIDDLAQMLGKQTYVVGFDNSFLVKNFIMKKKLFGVF
ncbi:hypothetical protein OAC78_03970 [Litorivicinus sp.]|jgi:inosine-uridine nucleoside N-ribohydrolase|nr:hypothetical protein [Litorivicinus sp.]